MIVKLINRGYPEMLKNIHHIMNCPGTRHLVVFAAAFLLCHAVSAQKPVIRQVDKTSGAHGERITLQGTFHGDESNTAVSFGAALGTVEFVSEQLMEVTVPGGATYDNIVVTDLPSGLTAETNFPFLYSFGGNHGVTSASLEGQIDFQGEDGLHDVCLCDFDNDGRNDVATANTKDNRINIFANTSTGPGLSNIAFNRMPFLLGAPSLHARCGDLNGDGRPDLILSEAGASTNRIFIFRNTSTGPGSFTFSIQAITIPLIKVKRIEIADIDADGKPELIITNQIGNTVTVLRNQSTSGAITFAPTPVTINVPGAASTDGLAVDDLDGDGLPEILVNQFLLATSNIFILKNNSTPGNISFAQGPTLSSATTVNLRVGDLDGDGKPDIAATDLGTSAVIVFRNQSNTNIAFASGVTIGAISGAWGIDFGDLDGDGKPDIVVSSFNKTISVLNNTSTPGSLSFSAVTHATTFPNRLVAIGDVDGDAKPDIVFSSVDDDINAIVASKMSILRNKNCLVPKINPAGPLTVCTEMLPVRLTTTASQGTTYEWKRDGTTVATGADAFFEVNAAGSYTVTAISEAGTCNETSAPVVITIDAGSTTGTAIASNNGPACPGSTIALNVTDVGGTEYRWTGPAGYSGTGLTPPAITNFAAENAGRYYVDVVVNGCVAQQTSTVVEVIGVPEFQVSHSGAEVICPPDTKTLAVTPQDPDFTYQWAEVSDGDIPGATGGTLDVTAGGQYFVKASHKVYPACAAIATDPVTVTFTSAPVASFSAPANACTSTVINFANQSSGASGQTLVYTWDFGDGTAAATDQNPTHQYSTAGDYTTTLTVSYADGGCAQSTSRTLSIAAAPSATIVAQDNATGLCPGGSLELSVDNTFSSYQWTTGETTPAITITQPGTYSVNVTSGACMVTAVIEIDELEGATVTATADPTEINEGETTQLLASGLSTYLWEPGEVLNDSTIADPVASPIQTTVFTVSGVDAEGCPASTTVEVSVRGDLIVNKLTPKRFISPNNGDDINTWWLVENILNYPQCGVTIYDVKGIEVYNAKPYNNDWDGTYNGRDLPDGVYYFIIRCDGEEAYPRTGSITILR